ncbi:MAG: ArsA family ATPase, partial [Rhodococcus sp.]|nr:ArsA family ATPase [Rhodococcus sp. (in: high G+C Gram-positive bacteria)]
GDLADLSDSTSPHPVADSDPATDAGRSGAAIMLGTDIPPVQVTHESGTGVDSVFAFRMHLPIVNPATLTLGRVEDSLVVGAEGVRRRIPLAAVLRRCIVAGAELDVTDLVVRFVPDQQVWPQ